MKNLTIIITISILLMAVYKKKYSSGLCSSLFLIVLLPSNLAINLGNLFSVTIHRVIVIVCLLMWLREKDCEFKQAKIPFLTILVLMALSLGLSTLLSGEIIVSLKRYLYFLFESVIFFVIIQTSIRDEKTLKKLMYSIFLGLVFAGIVGLIQRWAGFNLAWIFGVKQRTVYEIVRIANARDVSSTYLHRILFGYAMCYACIIFYLIIEGSDKIIQNLKNILFLCVCFLSLYYSFSRGPWIGFFLGYIVMFLYGDKQKNKKVMFVAVLLLIVLLMNPGVRSTIEGFYNSTHNATSLKGASYNWRYQVWQTSVERILSSKIQTLLFGFGGGSHVFMDFGYITLTTGRDVLMESWDCEFAILLYERGIVGFLLYLFLYLKIVSYFLKNRHLLLYNKSYFLVVFTSIVVVIFMKTNVSVFAPQLLYIEFFNIATFSWLITANKRSRTILPVENVGKTDSKI